MALSALRGRSQATRIPDSELLTVTFGCLNSRVMVLPPLDIVTELSSILTLEPSERRHYGLSDLT